MPVIPSRVTPIRTLVVVAAVAVYWWSFEGAGLNFVEIYKGMPGLWDLLRHMFPPDTNILLSLWTPFLETLQVGILASLILAGHNGAITTSLVAVVALYLGVDIAVLHKFRVKAENNGRD